MITENTLKFLSKLKSNNNREWFEANRAWYEEVRKDFIESVQQIIDDYSDKDNSIKGQTTKDCVFRINRDVRFSHDKTPYKKNFSAAFSKGGRKSDFAGYYLHIEPGKSFYGGGLWMPPSDFLNKVRQEIDYNWEEFKEILNEKTFKKTFKNLYKEDALKTVPKGYDKENPAIEYLKLKSFFTETSLSDKEITAKNFYKNLIKGFTILKPLNDFLNRAVD